VLSWAALLVPAAGVGFGSFLGLAPVNPSALLGLVAAVCFAAMLAIAAPASARADGEEQEEDERAAALDRRGAAICAVIFAAMGMLSAGLAWEAWQFLGRNWSLGLAAVAAACRVAALGFGGRSLR
jgi:hypothetical protein